MKIKNVCELKSAGYLFRFSQNYKKIENLIPRKIDSEFIRIYRAHYLIKIETNWNLPHQLYDKICDNLYD